jgi:hypothetical protein
MDTSMMYQTYDMRQRDSVPDEFDFVTNNDDMLNNSGSISISSCNSKPFNFQKNRLSIGSPYQNSPEGSNEKVKEEFQPQRTLLINRNCAIEVEKRATLDD